MPLKCGSESTDYSYFQLNELTRALSVMRKYGISEISEPYQKLYKLRGEIMGRLGLRVPKVPTLLGLIAGLSPGVIKVWHDAEYSWIAEARVRPDALPVYHRVTDEQAMAILKREVTKELEEWLMTPDPYVGE